MEQAPLPIKTKIAAWWMIGLLGIANLFNIVIVIKDGLSEAFYSGLLFAVLIGIFSFIFLGVASFLLFKKKRSGWTLLLVFILLHFVPSPFPDLSYIFLMPYIADVIGDTTFFFTLFLSISLILFPLFFLVTDRKNFWKIAT